MSTFTDRMIRAARLDPTVYEEVEADPTALGQATAVVVLSSVAGGLAGMSQGGGSVGLIVGTIASLVGWYIWAFLTYVIGTKLLPGGATNADTGQLLRTLGFAAAPGIVRVVGIVPGLVGLSFAVAALWSLAAMVVAVRQALDYESTGRAFAVCVIGWLVQVLVVGGLMLAVVGTITSVSQ